MAACRTRAFNGPSARSAGVRPLTRQVVMRRNVGRGQATGGGRFPARAPSNGDDATLARPGMDSWAPLRRSPLYLTRLGHAGVFTGSELIVWAGTDSVSGPDDRGARLNLATGRWHMLPSSNLWPRVRGTAIWTGREMIVWGGFTEADPPHETGMLDDGAGYSPRTDTWRRLSPSPLQARGGHAAVWTGSQMLVWGGGRLGGEVDRDPPFCLLPTALADGAAYDPTSDHWFPLPEGPLRGRHSFAYGWTGHEMIVWGGMGERYDILFDDGAAFDPGSGRWRTLPPAPLGPRADAKGVWTGDSFVIWGGSGIARPWFKSDGVAYTPESDDWRALPGMELEGAAEHSLSWTGEEVLILDGNQTADDGDRAYNPALNSWRRLPGRPNFVGSGGLLAWTGTMLITHGGGFRGDDVPRTDTACYLPR